MELSCHLQTNHMILTNTFEYETLRDQIMVNTTIINWMKHGMFQSFILTFNDGIHGQMQHGKIGIHKINLKLLPRMSNLGIMIQYGSM